jgi:hypothetical protein
VEQFGEALHYVPEELKTAELCRAAVEQSGGALAYVPEHLKTLELCRAAVEQDGGALQAEMLLSIMREDPQFGQYFPSFPEASRTREVCILAIKAFESVCAHIPKELQSEEFFVEAVSVNENGKALKYVPKEYRTLNVCMAALRAHPDMEEELFDSIPKDIQEEVRAALKGKSAD